ncbi:MAG TPA: amino acid ABC transporter substrate-binding protein [Chloroflexi bacterium]|jgi:ABC-type amino acid transport substrate-binding protein|nr:amino acid ABC transporter substrate-binding protein [Chloroflexota bacterium]
MTARRRDVWQWLPRPMRRFALLCALAAMVAVGGVALRTYGGLAGADPTWERIHREGQLRVGMDASFPPFEVVDGDGRFVGFDVDLATALAERWGVGVRFVDVHFDGLYDALQADKFDLIISALPYDRTMTRDVAYSVSYYDAGELLLVPAGANTASIADLDGGVCGVELGSTAHQLVRQVVRDRGLAIEVVAAREAEELPEQLLSGALDGIVCDSLTAHDWMGRWPDLQVVGPPLTSDPYVIAARPDSPELLQQVNLALREWRTSGYLEELQARWFGGS